MMTTYLIQYFVCFVEQQKYTRAIRHTYTALNHQSMNEKKNFLCY